MQLTRTVKEQTSSAATSPFVALLGAVIHPGGRNGTRNLVHKASKITSVVSLLVHLRCATEILFLSEAARLTRSSRT